MRVSQMNSLITEALFQNKTHWYVTYKWSYGHFWDLCLFRPKFGCRGYIPYTLAIRNVFFELADHEKPPVVSNHIIVISHRNAFIAIFVPKLGAMVMPLCPLCMGVSQMNSLIAERLSQNKTLHWCVVFNWSCGHFCEIFSLFWPKFGCHGNVP